MTAVIGLAAAVVLASSIRAQGSDRMPIGTNVSGLDDWSTEFTFVDVFKQSRPWFSGSASVWQDQRPLDLDEHGWVRSLLSGQVARTLMFWDLSRDPAAPAAITSSDERGAGWKRSLGAAGRTRAGPRVHHVDPARGGVIGCSSRHPPVKLRPQTCTCDAGCASGERFNRPLGSLQKIAIGS